MDRRAFLKSGLLLTALTTLSGGLISACNNENLAANESNKNTVAGKENTIVNKENTVTDESDNLSFKKIVKTDEEWKQILTPEQYEVAS